MTKYLILLAILLALYLYWKAQQKTISPKTDDIIERKGKQKEVFWDAQDFELSDDERTNSADD